MTDKQRFGFYFPAWRRACEANGWRMEKGRLMGAGIQDGALGEAALPSEWVRKVVTFARQIAAMEHRGPTVNDLRHGAHVMALGRDKSSTVLTNSEVDRVATLFKLLADPDDLDAMMHWQDPGMSEKNRLEWAIQHAAPEAYVREIASRKFGTRMWEWLQMDQMRQLLMTLKGHQRGWRRSAGGAPAEERRSEGNRMGSRSRALALATVENEDPF